MFVNEQNPGEAISAVKALQKANAQGQRIYHITQDNQSAILGNIHHDQATLDEIRNALNAGKEVITHTDTVSVPGWNGAGYIITDPITGDGAYKISGGGNGGKLIYEAIFELFWWMFDSVKGIAKANIFVTVFNFLVGVTEIVKECSGIAQWFLLSAYVVVTALIISLSLVTGGAALLLYSLVFNTLSSIVFNAEKRHYCKNL